MNTSNNDLFKATKSKYGYSDLKTIGFFCYGSDRNGDNHKNRRIEGIKLKCNYQYYDLEFNNRRIKRFDSNNINLETIKNEIMEAIK